METNDSFNQVISEEILRERIRKIIAEPQASWWQSFSRHPITAIIVGFIFTGLLSEYIKYRQDVAKKDSDKREHKYEMQRDSIRQKYVEDYARRIDSARQRHSEGRAAINLFSECLYDRITRSEMLGSALIRSATLPELESRKIKLDESYVKWNVQRNQIYLVVQDIDMLLWGQIEKSYISMVDKHRQLDNYLISGYDMRRKGKPWKADSMYIATEVRKVRHLSDKMLASIWTTTRVKERWGGN